MLLSVSQGVNNTLSVAEGISNFGTTIMIDAFFLVITFVLWVFVFKWFKHLIDNMVTNQVNTMSKLLEETRSQNSKLDLIRESLEPDTRARVRVVSNALFELASWRTLGILNTVRKENHIIDKDGTRKKIHNLLTVEYQNVRSKLDGYGTYRGKKLSKYMDDNWIELVAQVVESELYNENGENQDRAFTNVTMAFEKVKIEFYNRIN